MKNTFSVRGGTPVVNGVPMLMVLSTALALDSI